MTANQGAMATSKEQKQALVDLSRPVEALASARAMLAEGGCVLIGDERVAERFTVPGEPLDSFNYG